MSATSDLVPFLRRARTAVLLASDAIEQYTRTTYGDDLDKVIETKRPSDLTRKAVRRAYNKANARIAAAVYCAAQCTSECCEQSVESFEALHRAINTERHQGLPPGERMAGGHVVSASDTGQDDG